MISRNFGEKIGFFIPWLVILTTLILLFSFTSKGQVKSEMISPNFKKNSESLKLAVNKALDGTKGTYAVVIKNLKTKETYYQNEHEIFPSGSLYKVWVMAEAYDQINNGDLKEDEVLEGDISDLNKTFGISDDSAELTEGTITLSVSDSIKQMITISHNYAALLLTEKIKLSNVAKFLRNNDFKESKVGTEGEDPITTASDVAKFFEKLYRSELNNQEYTEKMFNLLKAQQLNDKLPKNLPVGTIVAHKTGEIDYYSHDGGIVYSPKGDYIIVVLSKSNSPAGAEDRIAQVSESVYNYFNKYLK